MLTGSVASAAFGAPRSTRDVDVVLDPTGEQLRFLVQQFSMPDFYADEMQALAALANRSQFNVIDSSSGWKIDFIIAEDSEYGRQAFVRRRSISIGGAFVFVASPEDVVIAKLRWAKLGRSERQLEDVAGILFTQTGALDLAYLERWIRHFGLASEWERVRSGSWHGAP